MTRLSPLGGAAALAACLTTAPATASANTFCIDYGEYPGRISETARPGALASPRGAFDPDVFERGDHTFIADGSALLIENGDLVELIMDAFAVTGTQDPNCIWVGGCEEVRRVDVSDPANPVIVETIPVPGVGDVERLSFSASQDALIVDGDDGNRRILLSGPCGSPTQTDTIPGLGPTTIASDTFDGLSVFVAPNALLTLDVATLQFTTATLGPGNATDVAVLPNRQFAIAGQFGTRLYEYIGGSVQLVAENTTLDDLLYIERCQTIARRRGDGVGLVGYDGAGAALVFIELLSLDVSGFLHAGSGVVVLGCGGGTITTIDSDTIRGHRLANAMSPATVHEATDAFVPQSTLHDSDAGIVYVGDFGGMTGGSLRSYQYSQLDLLQHLGAVDLGSAPSDLDRFTHVTALRGSASYVVAGSLADLSIVDVTDPGNPSLTATLPGASGAVAVSDDGARAVRSVSPPAFQTLDLSDPANPQTLATVSTPNGVEDLLLDGTNVIVANFGQTARWDVSNPASPVLDHATPYSGIRSVAGTSVAEQYILGTTAPTNTLYRYDFATQSELSSVSVAGGELATRFVGGVELVYASDQTGAVFVIDWTDPADPILLGEYADGIFAPKGLFATDETVVVADASFPGSVRVLPAHGTTGTSTSEVTPGVASNSLKVWPNPFRNVATIELALGRESHVQLAVYDLTGRLVRSLPSNGRPAGRSVLSWDGRDDVGLPAAAGVYFLRATAGNQAYGRKVTLLR